MPESGVARWEVLTSWFTGFVSEATYAPAKRNACDRQPGKKPVEGEVHVRFGEAEL